MEGGSLSWGKRKKIRKLIVDSLPGLSQFYTLPLKRTFQEFVESYDEMIYSKACKKPPNQCLKFFAQKGDWRNVRIAIKKGADDWNSGMEEAALGGYKDLVEFFIEKGAKNWNGGMYIAAQGGHKDLVEFFIKKGAVPTDYIEKQFNL